MTTGLLAPDPVLTAGVYCQGYLDRVIHGAAAPVLEALRRGGAGPWMLWWVRYSKNGDHLKLRLHGPESEREEARRLLVREVEALFATLPAADPEAPRTSSPAIPSIDLDDDAAGDYPDRTLLWTRYRRSHVSFGPKQLLDDDAYVARITACLGCGAELVLETTSPGDDGQIPGSARLRTLLTALVTGLAGAGLDAEECTEYLAYHRDWLLRFAVADRAKEQESLALFDRRITAMRPAVEQLHRTTALQWGSAPPAGDDTATGRWRRAAAEICAFAAPFRHDADRLGDPFTRDAAFPLVFKAFHGVANQVGLNLLNEAFLHHLLLRVAEDGASARMPALATVEA